MKTLSVFRFVRYFQGIVWSLVQIHSSKIPNENDKQYVTLVSHHRINTVHRITIIDWQIAMFCNMMHSMKQCEYNSLVVLIRQRKTLFRYNSTHMSQHNERKFKTVIICQCLLCQDRVPYRQYTPDTACVPRKYASLLSVFYSYSDPMEIILCHISLSSNKWQ